MIVGDRSFSQNTGVPNPGLRPRAVIAVTDTARGGAPRRLATVAKGMSARGWEILFVSLLPAGPVLRDLKEAGIETTSLEIKSPLTGLRGLRRFRRLVQAFDPQLVQTALWHANLLARVACLGSAVPVVNGHESIDRDKNFARVWIDRATRKLATRHAAVADAVAEIVAERDWVSRSDITVIPVAADWEHWKPKGQREAVRRRLGIPDGACVVGWSGRLHPVKNLPALVRALPALPEKWWLLLVGDGEERMKLERLAGSLGVRHRVCFIGETADPSPFVEACDVFCLVSLWEGLPTSLMEAMAMGLPVVAPAVGGVVELIRPDETGILLASTEPSQIAQTLLRAIERQDLGARAAAAIRRHYSAAKVLDSYEQLWQGASEGRRR